ncbi:MAG TPA: LytTR family DNA-binding domain-containing protein [Povalibacter sp.]|uniref:LytR/AlgR family response regulator transcription factor n=1 Tax=Povalibacter sp. TaxID=1962978 RepID=UPI002CB063AB|nr:LytTR family DNA-binding domain-containing protein [Povalibacter sp.]HMN46365.1 LytTR family DNA-binding domain-containing protein [Povalibacter sp.]
MTSAIIADDEPLLREELRDMMRELWPSLDIIDEARDGMSALQKIQERRPDVAFLDVRMPGLSGLEVAEQIQDIANVVFITAYDEHAIAAFEQGAVDYLLKPVKATRLAATIKRLRERIEGGEGRSPRGKPLNWIQATAANKLRFFAVSDVLYFQSDSKYTRLVTAGHEALIRKSLADLMRALDAETFRQINRGVIVNVSHIESVERGSAGEMFVRMRGHAIELQISRAHQAQFRGM